MAAGNIADRQTGLHRLGDNRQLQIGGEPPPPGDAGDTSAFENVSDIGVCLGLTLGLRLKPVSGQNRVQFTTPVSHPWT
jgi:hypothetical protein